LISVGIFFPFLVCSTKKNQAFDDIWPVLKMQSPMCISRCWNKSFQFVQFLN
jgi:hypothetical protein